MCPLDRAPVSPSEHNHHHEHVLENFGCTHIATVKEEAKKEQGENDPDRTPLELELGEPLSLKDEPNTTTLGAPVYSVGEGMSLSCKQLKNYGKSARGCTSYLRTVSR